MTRRRTTDSRPVWPHLLLPLLAVAVFELLLMHHAHTYTVELRFPRPAVETNTTGGAR